MAEITSRRSAAAAHLRRLGRDREYRYLSGEMLCDGLRCLREAMASSTEITAVLTASGADGRELTELQSSGVPVYGAPAEIFDYISPLKTAQDILFSCRIPAAREASTETQNLVLDSVQDPGNVGTAIRSAAAFGIDSVILVGPCADPYSPKTARASMGAVFHKNVVQSGYDGLRRLKERGMTLYGAAAGGGSLNFGNAELSRASVAVGSEGAGLSDETLALCAGLIAIPMEPLTESLNAGVAASIIMWEMYKGARENYV
ncbi:MAG: RNA methyltransferase, partial [Oscillospiraceae bacterium]|nr:RNA methyltransferase [Oscillospiraceae bacterium]